MNKSIYLWKSMSPRLHSGYGKKKWKMGKWYKIKGELEMCSNGFHASKKILDSMSYVSIENLAKVEVRGKNLKQSDKQCWEEMRIIQAWKWKKKDSVALAVYVANLVIDIFENKYPEDKRPRNAINAAKAWLKNSTDKNKGAARDAGGAACAAWAVWAAGGAPWAAAEAARDAAWAAARAAGNATEATRAVRDTAGDTARAARAARTATRASTEAALAARVAGGASRFAVTNKYERWIKRRIKKLEEII